jgi:hypothetical protein
MKPTIASSSIVSTEPLLQPNQNSSATSEAGPTASAALLAGREMVGDFRSKVPT